MKKPKTFQIAVLGIFSVLLLVGFLGFSGKIPFPGGSGTVNYGQVTLWGTVPQDIMQTVISDNANNNKSITITYVQKNKTTIMRDFVEALADGNGPDIIMVTQDEVMNNFVKIALLPYTVMSERDFKNTFVEEGEMLLRPEGIIAMPITIDPIIMYWNRDIFTNASIVAPPTRWSEFYGLAPRIVASNQNGDIKQSFVAFGEYQNVVNAKEILSALILQSGAPIVTFSNGKWETNFGTNQGAERAIGFFAEFARQDKDSYSWNRSLPTSLSMFQSGDLALYFGYASEYSLIKQQNPHLNFDIAQIPQTDNAAKRVTFGRMQSLAVTKASKNPAGAVHAVLLLSSSEMSAALAKAMALPPVRRDLLSQRPSDAVFSILYDSALISRAWYDPLPAATSQLFQGMIEGIGSGQTKVSQALSVVRDSINRLLPQQ